MSSASANVGVVSKSQTENGNQMFLRNRAGKASNESAPTPYEGIAHRTRHYRNVSNSQRVHGRRSNTDGIVKGATVVGGIVVVAAFAVIAVGGYATVNTYDNCVVAGKDRTTNSEGQSEMRVYTENCGTFTIGDDWLRGNFMTADMYGSLQEGETYDFEASGFRIGLVSMFPNIVSISQG